jgi:division protein CdvB (Snf7/Vps24/ESCRT-III family)
MPTMHEFEAQNQRQQTINLAEIFLQQSARLLETQAAAARAVMRTQARSFAALGGPDLSALYAEENERRFSELLKTSTDQAVTFMRQTNETVRQFQQVLNQLVSQQTTQLTQHLRTAAEDIGQRTQQVEQQLREASTQTPQQARNAAEQALQGSGASSGADERARSKRPA